MTLTFTGLLAVCPSASATLTCNEYAPALLNVALVFFAALLPFAEKLTLGVANYWSPEFGGGGGDADALELTAAYAFSGKLFNFFSPTISGLVGWQWVEDNDVYVGWDPYMYWNAGLTLGFMERWALDVRYWDTDLSGTDTYAGSISDARVVGTLSASF